MNEVSMENETEKARLTAEIVAAYVGNNILQPNELPALVGSVRAAIEGLAAEPAPEPKEKPKPAVSINRSITPDHIVCLEDGERFSSLKLHLRAKHGLSPEAYREKWGLKPDYPMVAPSYRKNRSELAPIIHQPC
ncbi:MAG: MucR family transcriptional regulator [Rhodobacteraceae bacterium]|nr:MucR family transcriptional regulator [Paracoccaceae bacterium]